LCGCNPLPSLKALLEPSPNSPTSYGRGEKEGNRGAAWARDQTWMPTRSVGCEASVLTYAGLSAQRKQGAEKHPQVLHSSQPSVGV